MIGRDAQAHLLEEVLEEMKRARDRIHSMMVRGYRREEFSCGCL